MVIVLASLNTQAQTIYLSGYTRDSTTFELLPYVTIYTLKGKPLAASNGQGYFTLSSSLKDTIVFSRLGYKPVQVAPDKTVWDMNVLLPETMRVLDEVVVYDKYVIHGHQQIQESIKESAAIESSPYKNQTQAPNAVNMIQTVGPGMVLNGVLSSLFGTDKEKIKLAKGKSEYVRTQVFYEVMQSQQVKEYMMREFSIDETEYLKRLEKFKVAYPTAVYVRSREEIIRLMTASFATK
jgi:hypothetical protein